MIATTAPASPAVSFGPVALGAGAAGSTVPVVFSTTDTLVPGLTITFSYMNANTNGVNVWIIKNPLYINNYNLASFLGSFIVNVIFNNVGASTTIAGYTITMLSHSIGLTDASIPISYWTDLRSTTAASGLNLYDITVIQYDNYGVRLDGKGNPMLDGNIQLNGQDRFDIQLGQYFNYYQPYNHHTRTPADGINVYSFALHPEQHQPSGSANLSRIDSTYLILRFWDPLRANTNHPALNLATNSNFNVYDFSYNVLRIMSGMGGLAYSN